MDLSKVTQVLDSRARNSLENRLVEGREEPAL